MNKESKVIIGIRDSKYVLNKMSRDHMIWFNKNYGHIDSSVLIERMNHVLDGLLPEEIDYGLKEMDRQKFIPEFGAFRALCESAGLWKSHEDAWDEAIQYEKMNINQINTVIKRVIDLIKKSQVNFLLQDKKRFIDKYKQEVALERTLGSRPEFYRRLDEKDCTDQNWIPCNKEEAKSYLDGIRHLIKI